MSYKQILITEDLHRRVKVAATLLDLSIKDYTERALRAAMNADDKLNPPRRLVDSGVSYEMEE